MLRDFSGSDGSLKATCSALAEPGSLILFVSQCFDPFYHSYFQTSGIDVSMGIAIGREPARRRSRKRYVEQTALDDLIEH